jgi:hypothetical protein
MIRPARKVRERYLLSTFLHKEGIDAEVRDSEGPDFLVSIGGREVGIEVTELHHRADHPSSSLQAREAVASRVVHEARRRFQEQGGPSLSVSLLFSPAFDPGTVQRRELAEYLCDLVWRILPPAGELNRWRPAPEDYRAGTPLISYVQVLHQPQHIVSHWRDGEAGWVAPLTLSLTQEAVDAKAARLPQYRQRAGEQWLLLAIYGRNPSQFFDDVPQFNPSDVRSPFDRTYLYDAFRSCVTRLGSRSSND